MKFFKPEQFEDLFGNYGVSRDGRVCNFKTGKVLSDAKHTAGYRSVNLYISAGNAKTHLVHRLVAAVFLGSSDLQVNHKDGNKVNNHIHNLEYVTQSQNITHAKETGLMPKATYRKLSDQQVKDIKMILEIRKRCNSLYPKHEHIAIMFKVSHSMIEHIEKGRHWND